MKLSNGPIGFGVALLAIACLAPQSQAARRCGQSEVSYKYEIAFRAGVSYETARAVLDETGFGQAEIIDKCQKRTDCNSRMELISFAFPAQPRPHSSLDQLRVRAEIGSIKCTSVRNYIGQFMPIAALGVWSLNLTSNPEPGAPGIQVTASLAKDARYVMNRMTAFLKGMFVDLPVQPQLFGSRTLKFNIDNIPGTISGNTDIKEKLSITVVVFDGSPMELTIEAQASHVEMKKYSLNDKKVIGKKIIYFADDNELSEKLDIFISKMGTRFKEEIEAN